MKTFVIMINEHFTGAPKMSALARTWCTGTAQTMPLRTSFRLFANSLHQLSRPFPVSKLVATVDTSPAMIQAWIQLVYLCCVCCSLFQHALLDSPSSKRWRPNSWWSRLWSSGSLQEFQHISTEECQISPILTHFDLVGVHFTAWIGLMTLHNDRRWQESTMWSCAL